MTYPGKGFSMRQMLNAQVQGSSYTFWYAMFHLSIFLHLILEIKISLVFHILLIYIQEQVLDIDYCTITIIHRHFFPRFVLYLLVIALNSWIKWRICMYIRLWGSDYLLPVFYLLGEFSSVTLGISDIIRWSTTNYFTFYVYGTKCDCHFFDRTV